jgi:integrase/recombinase XerD
MTRKAPSDRFCRPVSLWPPIDQAAWAAASTPSGPFDQRKAGSPWSPATWRKSTAGYGFFLTWLDGRGKLDPDEPIARRVTRERLVAYLEYLKQRNRGHTIHNRIQELGDALRVLAPEHDWGWVSRAAGRLRAEAVPARDKLSCLRPVGELIAAGLALMDYAETAPRLSPFKRAILYRDGLMVAFLGFHPLRLRSFRCVRLGAHLQENLGFAVLAITAGEMKGRRPHEAEIAELLRQRLLRYVRHHRPVLLKARPRGILPTDYLWVSAEGTPLSEEGIYRRVVKATGRSGAPIGPHLFRTCAITTVAVRAPKDIHIMTPTLDHSGPAIGERYYNMAGSLEAFRSYAKVVSDLRRSGKPKTTPKLKRRKE